MKNVQFKTGLLVSFFSLVISLCSAMTGGRYLQGRYKQSDQGSACFPYTTLPGVCTPAFTGVICTTTFGSATRQWYQDACMTPYYMEVE
ncbi:hypothetical protein LX66_1840 [Chitinophaga japonensis]|uniref:Uncharacterized protein n=1 Tax=Chitinophaga japonensis TaxID=104662 RepID=A0A562T258_CHIJA|nr:hypothetical protein LX66_1840 [Chitinophaga japonensis]